MSFFETPALSLKKKSKAIGRKELKLRREKVCKMYMNLQELKINDGLRKTTVFEKKFYGRISLLGDKGT
jgi:hypothetical protein